MSNRRYHPNHNYFDVIDTEEKAYLLGFFAADGCNTESRNLLRVGVNIRDADMIRRFQTAISPDCALQQCGEILTFQVSSPQLSRRLTELGCPSRKTFSVTYPADLPKDLHRHYIRGVLDGDGYFYLRPPRGVVLGITGYLPFLDEINAVTFSETGMRWRLRAEERSQSNAFGRITKQGLSACERLADWLYGDATIYLARKHLKYLAFQEMVKPLSFRPRLNLHERAAACTECGKQPPSALNLCRSCYNAIHQPNRNRGR